MLTFHHLFALALLLWSVIGAVIWYDRVDDNLERRVVVRFSLACGPVVWLVVTAVLLVVFVTRLVTKLFS